MECLLGRPLQVKCFLAKQPWMAIHPLQLPRQGKEGGMDPPQPLRLWAALSGPASCTGAPEVRQLQEQLPTPGEQPRLMPAAAWAAPCCPDQAPGYRVAENGRESSSQGSHPGCAHEVSPGGCLHCFRPASKPLCCCHHSCSSPCHSRWQSRPPPSRHHRHGAAQRHPQPLRSAAAAGGCG